MYMYMYTSRCTGVPSVSEESLRLITAVPIDPVVAEVVQPLGPGAVTIAVCESLGAALIL